MSIQPAQISSLDDCIESFENAWNDCQPPAVPDVRDYFPPPTVEDYQQSVIELLRVDMERRWTIGQRKSMDDYRGEFPQLWQDSQFLGALAFEEFRLRTDLNESVTPESYAKKYGVDITAWPSVGDHETHALRMWNESTLDLLADESDRLVSSVVDYPEVGDKFCEFTIREVLGEGKFSRVYLAHQADLAERPVVLKVSPELFHESDNLARLQHTHIVPIYSLHRQNSLHAICMPFFGRQTLEDRLRTSLAETDGSPAESQPQPMLAPEKDCCALIAKLAAALHHAHDRGIVHRDLKPANILIGDDAEPFILDFNLSESLVVGGPVSLFVGGTLPYMAPEHLEAVLSRARLDQRCDVYSLGVILYRMVTGQLPFPGHEGNFVDAVARMVKDRRRTLSWRENLSGRCSSDMASIIDKCLQPDANERYPSAAALAEDLQRHLDDRPLRHATNRSPVQRTQKWWRRNRHLASIGSITMAAAILLSISIGITLWRGHQNQKLIATANAAEFHDEFARLRLPLTPLGEAAPTIKNEAIDRIKQSLQRFDVLKNPNWQRTGAIQLLSSQDRVRMLQEIGELLYLVAFTSHETQQTEGVEQTQLLATAATCFLFPAAENLSPQMKTPHQGVFRLEDFELPSSLKHRLTAVRLAAQGQYDEARRSLEQAVVDEPENVMLWLLLGLVQRELDELSLSELSLTRCIALAPNSPISYFHRGVTRFQQEHFAEAAKDFSSVIALRAQTPEAHFNRALAYRDLKQFELALEDCNRALELGWDEGRVYLLRSDLFRLLGDLESADADHVRGISRQPQDAAGWTARGKAQIDDDHDAAIADLENAIQLEPRSREAMQNLAHIYAEILGQNETALKWMSRIEELYPNYATAPASKAVLLARLGRDDEVQPSIHRALELSHSAETYYLIASAYAQMADRSPEMADSAVDALRTCLNLDNSWFNQMIYDVDFAPIKTNPRLNKILAACNVMINGESANQEK